MELIAHRNDDERLQPFSDHSNHVAALAAGFAAEFGGQEQARWIAVPHAGAWIEMGVIFTLLSHLTVAPHAGAWINGWLAH